MLDLFHKIRPRSPILRAYLLGIATGMGAAIAYQIGRVVREERSEGLHLRRTKEELPEWASMYGVPGVDEDAEEEMEEE